MIMSTLQNVFFSGIAKKSVVQFPLKNGCVSHGHAIAFKHPAIIMHAKSKDVKDVRPPIANFKPATWGDIFSRFSFDDQVQRKYAEEIETLKKEVRSMLMAAKSTKQMILIDKLERLGLAYHFETEIENKLKQVYIDQEDDNEDYDLFATSLRFRLLRQHRYHVSTSDFNKFLDKENTFKETLNTDVAGLLSLYEAAHVRMHDENILDEAMAFTTHHLSRMLPQLEVSLKEKVQHALEYPVHKSLAVLQIRFHILRYEEDDSRDELLLRLAKLNFNYLRNIYGNELHQLTKWYNKFGLQSKLPYARHNMVGCYMWSLPYHHKPQYSWVRMMIAKTYKMLSILDDTHDNYATIEELELFNQALERWDIDEINHLPDYMKSVYKYIMSVSEEFERSAEKAEKSYAIPHFINGIKQLSKVYFEEQKWYMERKLPKFEEYVKITQITALLFVSFIAVIPGLKPATQETIQWLKSNPQIVSSLGLAGRLYDDIGSYQRESRGGKMLTIVDCYMKDKGVTEEEALSSFAEIIENEWKYINAEWLKSHPVPNEIVEQFVNLMRLSHMSFKINDDGYTNPERNSSFGRFVYDSLVDPPLLL